MAQSDLFANLIHDSFTVNTDDDTVPKRLRGTRAGQLYVSDWRQELLLAGTCYHVTVGTITGGGNVSLITGGGDGTTIDQDQPELAIGVAAGTTLIPIEIDFAGRVDVDADAEVGDFVIWADLAANVPTDGTSTTETPVNMLHGATDFGGTCKSAYTVDMTDSTVSEILMYRTVRESETTAAGLVTVDFHAHYEPKLPMHMIGPCSLYVAWGGTAAVAGMVVATFAAVPNARFTR